MVDLVEGSKTLVEFCENGDLMSALSYFEGELKTVIDNTTTYQNEELLKLLKEISVYIENEEWAGALENVEKLDSILTSEQST